MCKILSYIGYIMPMPRVHLFCDAVVITGYSFHTSLCQNFRTCLSFDM